MEKRERRIKALLPAIGLAVVLVLFVGLSFLPAVRGNKNATGASAYARTTDEEALRVLGCCRTVAATERFETTMTGTIKARVFGIPYTQKVTGKRFVDGDEFTEISESVSAFVKVAVRREKNADGFFVSHGEYKKKRFAYGAPKSISRKEYVTLYGLPFTELVKYDLDGSIVSASTAGENTFKYVLEPRRATEYSRNEVKTVLGGKSYPKYESVEMTLVSDGERAQRITVKEKFRVDKFGGTECVAEYTEIFKYGDGE